MFPVNDCVLSELHQDFVHQNKFSLTRMNQCIEKGYKHFLELVFANWNSFVYDSCMFLLYFYDKLS